MKFPIKDFVSKCDQIRSFLRISSHLLYKSLIKNFIFCAVKLKVYIFCSQKYLARGSNHNNDESAFYYWILTLRNLVKFIIRNACKKYQFTCYADPNPGPLTKDKTEQYFPFQVIGVDYAGLIFYLSKTRKDWKNTFFCFHAVLAELYI